jgi:hypothetical protein
LETWKFIAAVAEWRWEAVLMAEDYEIEMLRPGTTGYLASLFESGCEFVSTLGIIDEQLLRGKKTHGGVGWGLNWPGLIERASKP